MANVYMDASKQDDRTQEERIAAFDSPANSMRYDGKDGRIDVAQGLDVGDIEKQLREMGGDLYNQGDLESVLRNTGYQTGGMSLAQQMANRKQEYDMRRNSETTGSGVNYGWTGGDSDGGGGRSNNSGGGGQQSLPGNQFDDAYSSTLETIAKSQMGEVRSNPGLDQLMKFLSDRFTDLSTNPGYSADEMSLLNTQSFEPIEAFRRATQQRELERTSRAGYLPSSGLTRDNQRLIDTDADRMRTIAGRDLSINAINKRNADLNQALNIGQLRGLQIPGAQRGEELSLANLLYQMPRTAMMDALAVINGSPSSTDAFNQALQLATQNRYQDQFNSQQNAALWGQIGSILENMFK